MLFGVFDLRVCRLFCCGLWLGVVARICAVVLCLRCLVGVGGVCVGGFGWFGVIVCVGVFAFGGLVCGVLVI